MSDTANLSGAQLSDGNATPESGAQLSTDDRLGALLERERDEQNDPTLEPTRREASDENPEGQTQEDKLTEWEWNGKKWAVPEELKNGYQRQQDYTVKTSEVAAMRRQVQAEAQEAAQLTQISRQIPQVIGEFTIAQKALAEYQQLDWARVRVDYPDRYASLVADYQLAERQAQEAGAKVQHAIGYVQNHQVSQQNHAIAEGMKVLTAELKYDAKMAREMEAHAAKHGIPANRLLGMEADPGVVKLLWQATQYEKLMSSNPNAKRVPTNSPANKPGATPGQSSGITGQQAKDARQSLRRTGSVEDAARLIRL